MRAWLPDYHSSEPSRQNPGFAIVMGPFDPHPNLPIPLPQVPGPKLPPFTLTGHAAIQFVEELGDESSSADSRVWKIRIHGKERYFALKVVSIPTYQRSSPTYLISDSCV